MPDYEDISDDDQSRLDAVCKEFEIELTRDGAPPEISEFIASVPEILHEQLSDRLELIKLDYNSRSAETISIREIVNEEPSRLDPAKKIPRQIPSDSSTKTSAIPKDESPATLIVEPSSEKPANLLSKLISSPLDQSNRSSSSGPGSETDRIAEISPAYDDHHKYVVEEEIDRGGMGVVLKVRDLRLQRTIALKVIRGQENTESSSRKTIDECTLHRFVREAQITGRLDHPGVVPIHELATDDENRLYFTMKFVEGETLKSVFQEHWQGSTHWTQSRIVDVIIRVCETLAFAHSRGVIHRDLKPANIMVGKFGEAYVMDWGLAKVVGEAEADLGEFVEEQLDSSSHQTIYGAAVGTPYYMPPEQAAGKLDELDSRTDVYALGTLLYELLTKHRPYASATPQSGQAVIQKVLQGPPLPIREHNGKAPPELAAIAQKAMQRDMAARYQSASELAEELRAFLSQRVVAAYRTGLVTRLTKWVARNQVLTLAGMLTLVSIIGALLVVMVMQNHNRNEMIRKNKELSDLVKEKDDANRLTRVAQRESSGLSLISHSRKLREAGNVTLASLLALEAVEKYPKPQATEALYAAAAELVSGINLQGTSGAPVQLAWSPDDKHIVTVHADGRGFIWSPEVSQPMAQMVNREERSFAAARYSKDGKSIVTVGADGTLAVWDAESGIRTLAMDVGHPRVLNSADILRPDLLDVAFCLDENCIVTITSHQTVHLIDLIDRREIAKLQPPESDSENALFRPAPFTVMQVSPDGHTLVVGCADGTLLTWNLFEHRLVSAVRGHEQAVQAICFAPDGQSFVTSDLDNSENHTGSKPARVWESRSGEKLQDILPKGLSVSCVAYHPTRRCIALGLTDGSLCLWNTDTNAAFCFSQPQADNVHRVRFSRNGDQLVTVTGATGLATWQVSEINGALKLSERDHLTGHLRPVQQQAFSGTGLELVSASSDLIRIWQTSVQRPVPSIGSTANPYAVRINSVGDRIFALDSGGTQGQLWSYPQLEELAVLDFGGDFMLGEFTTDLRHFVTTTTNGACRLWNVNDGVLESSLENSEMVWAQACFGGKLLLSGPAGTAVWNWTNGQKLMSIPKGDASVHRLAPSGRVLLADPIAGATRRIVRIDPDSGNVTPIPGADVTTLGGFSVDERYVWCIRMSGEATAASDVLVIDTEANRVLFTTQRGNSRVRNVAFSVDGSRMLVDYLEHPTCSVEIYSVPDGRLLTHFGVRQEAVIGWSSDLSRVVTRSLGRGTRLWNGTSGKIVGSLDLTGETQVVDFSDDGTLCAVQLPPATDNSDEQMGNVALWDSEHGQLIAGLPGINEFRFGSAFLSDRSALLTISRQQTLRLWPIAIDRIARKFIDRSLTSDEQMMYGVDASTIEVAELPIRKREWNSLEEQIRLLSPVTKERRAAAWSLLDRVTRWLGENPDPADVQLALTAVETLVTGPFDTDPQLLAKIAAFHESHGDSMKAARLMEWAAMHPRADSLTALLRHSRKFIAPALASEQAADELIERARFGSNSARAVADLTKARAWAETESSYFAAYLAAREFQLAEKFDQAAQIFAKLIADETAGSATLLHFAECELALLRPQVARDVIRANLDRKLMASPEIWDLWLQIAFRDLGVTPQQVQSELPLPTVQTSGEFMHEQHVRWLLEQLVNQRAIRINCGGDRYIAANGDEWGRDAFFTSGHDYFGTIGDAAAFSNPIRNTLDGVLYQTERFFNHERTDIAPGYRIPIPNGTYSVKLGFAEIYQVDRSFDVRVENQVFLHDYDPSRTDADWATAFEHRFQVIVEDGQFDLYFVAHQDTDPKISCIQISAIPGKVMP